MLLTGAAASGQDDSVLTVNPSAEPLAQEEMHRMVEEAAEAFYQNAELMQELESEIQFLHQEIPVENYPAEEWGLKREIRSSRASERLITAPL